MLLALGWAIIQTSHEVYKDYDDLDFDEIDKLDTLVEKQDLILFAELENWIKNNANQWFTWNLTGRANNHTGILQFHESRNHLSTSFAVHHLFQFIARQSKGSHGLIYYNDLDSKNPHLYKVIKLLDGELTISEDTHFSPFSSVHAFGGDPDIWNNVR